MKPGFPTARFPSSLGMKWNGSNLSSVLACHFAPIAGVADFSSFPRLHCLSSSFISLRLSYICYHGLGCHGIFFSFDRARPAKRYPTFLLFVPTTFPFERFFCMNGESFFLFHGSSCSKHWLTSQLSFHSHIGILPNEILELTTNTRLRGMDSQRKINVSKA